MASLTRRLLIGLLVANYALAVSVGPRFHAHPYDDPHSAHAAADGHCASQGGTGHEGCGEHAAPSDHHGGGVVYELHDCPVCEFLSQQPVPQSLVRPNLSTILVSRAPAARPLQAAQGNPLPWFSRGPPQAG